MVQRVLITGAAGSIGRMLRLRLAKPGRMLRLLDVAGQPQPTVGESVELVTADLADRAALAEACADVDAVVHLAGIPTEAPWPEIQRVNIDGTQHLFEAAQRAGVPRMVLASSNHACGFYSRADIPAGSDALPDDLPPRPDTYYGVSKAANEAVGSLFASRYGMTVIALRIGGCKDAPEWTRDLATWLSPDDCARLVEAALTTGCAGFRTVWGISRNTRRWWSLVGGTEIGYAPQDDAEVYAQLLIAKHGEPDLTGDPLHNLVGGPFCTMPLGAG